MYRQIFFNLFLVFILMRAYAPFQYIPLAHALLLGLNTVACSALFLKRFRDLSFAQFALLPGLVWGLALYYTVQQDRDATSQTIVAIVTVVWIGLVFLGPYFRDLYSLGRDEDT